MPISDHAAETVFDGREIIKRILDRKDPRLFIVIGPCSIHDPIAAYDYAQRLQRLADEVRDTLFSSCGSISRSHALPSAGKVSLTTRAWTIPSISRKAWRRRAPSFCK